MRGMEEKTVSLSVGLREEEILQSRREIHGEQQIKDIRAGKAFLEQYI